MSEDGHWKEYDELIEEQQYWNKKTFTIVTRDGTAREVDKLKFILGLRSALIKKFGNEASALTRRQIVNFLDMRYKVRNELRRYCDLSEDDFESMLDGASFPYLDRAWASMFHPGVLQDMVEDRQAFNDIDQHPKSKRDQPAQQPAPEESQSKATEKTPKVQTTIQKQVAKRGRPKKVVEESQKPKRSLYTEIPQLTYTLDGLLKQISDAAKLDRFTAKVVNNRIRVLLFRQKMKLMYADHPIKLSEFIRICITDKVSTACMDEMFESKRLFTNIVAGNTKGIHQWDDIKRLFKNAFGIELLPN